jgi:hypothetical protein
MGQLTDFFDRLRLLLHLVLRIISPALPRDDKTKLFLTPSGQVVIDSDRPKTFSAEYSAEARLSILSL